MRQPSPISLLTQSRQHHPFAPACRQRNTEKPLAAINPRQIFQRPQYRILPFAPRIPCVSHWRQIPIIQHRRQIITRRAILCQSHRGGHGRHRRGGIRQHRRAIPRIVHHLGHIHHQSPAIGNRIRNIVAIRPCTRRRQRHPMHKAALFFQNRRNFQHRRRARLLAPRQIRLAIRVNTRRRLFTRERHPLAVRIRPQTHRAVYNTRPIGFFHRLAAARPTHHHQISPVGKKFSRRIAAFFALYNQYLRRRIGQTLQAIQRPRHRKTAPFPLQPPTGHMPPQRMRNIVLTAAGSAETHHRAHHPPRPAFIHRHPLRPPTFNMRQVHIRRTVRHLRHPFPLRRRFRLWRQSRGRCRHRRSRHHIQMQQCRHRPRRRTLIHPVQISIQAD